MGETSKGIKVARIIAVVFVVAVLFVALYFLFFNKSGNDGSKVFAEYNTVIKSEVNLNFDDKMGSLESGDFYQYSQSQNLDYDKIYLEYYLNVQIMEGFADGLVYAGNFRSAKVTNIINALEEYKTDLTAINKSIALFEGAKEQYGATPTEQQENAILANFKVVLSDFNNLVDTLRELAENVFLYVSEFYYQDVDAFKDEKFVFVYCLNEQAKILSTSEIDDVLYDDTMALIEGYEYVLGESFTTQSTDENIRLMINKFVNSGDKFAGLLQSKDKGKFVNDTTDENLKYDYQVVMRGLGLSGRL